jgi:AAA+ ATPase superfamily predicted ATPase
MKMSMFMSGESRPPLCALVYRNNSLYSGTYFRVGTRVRLPVRWFSESDSLQSIFALLTPIRFRPWHQQL